jgi:hypothetical protein
MALENLSHVSILCKLWQNKVALIEGVVRLSAECRKVELDFAEDRERAADGLLCMHVSKVLTALVLRG